jgi:hypothetical protein
MMRFIENIPRGNASAHPRLEGHREDSLSLFALHLLHFVFQNISDMKIGES